MPFLAPTPPVSCGPIALAELIDRRRIVAVRYLPLDLAGVQVVGGDRRVRRLGRRSPSRYSRSGTGSAALRLPRPPATACCRPCRRRRDRRGRRSAAATAGAARRRWRRQDPGGSGSTAPPPRPRPPPPPRPAGLVIDKYAWIARISSLDASRIGRMLLRPSDTMTRRLSSSMRSVTPTSGGTPGMAPR